ncbi:MAG: hypothetical protein L0241_00685 [Planctomycetia bacterium]|nr:hypothetical protein [Planctomycetia bacterium]
MNFFWMVLTLVIISTVVGAIAKMLNNLQEQNAQRRVEQERQARAERADERGNRGDRPPRAAPVNAGGGRQPNSDMDRFLAEIDRLRRKQAGAPDQPQPAAAQPVAPVVQPVKPAPDKPRPRVVAELAEPQQTQPPGAPSFGTSPQAPTRTAPVGGQIEELPVATVLKATSSTGAPATRVTRIAGRARPAAKSLFGKNLTTLLGTGHGVAMAVVLQEILGPPKCKQ